MQSEGAFARVRMEWNSREAIRYAIFEHKNNLFRTNGKATNATNGDIELPTTLLKIKCRQIEVMWTLWRREKYVDFSHSSSTVTSVETMRMDETMRNLSPDVIEIVTVSPSNYVLLWKHQNLPFQPLFDPFHWNNEQRNNANSLHKTSTLSSPSHTQNASSR